MATRIHVTQQDDEWGYAVGEDFTPASSRTDAINEATQYVIEQKGEGKGSFYITVDGTDGGEGETDALTVDDDVPGSAPHSDTPTPNQQDTDTPDQQ